jgi:hypothetical protein
MPSVTIVCHAIFFLSLVFGQASTWLCISHSVIVNHAICGQQMLADGWASDSAVSTVIIGDKA